MAVNYLKICVKKPQDDKHPYIKYQNVNIKITIQKLKRGERVYHIFAFLYVILIFDICFLIF